MNNESVANCTLRENTIHCLESSCISVPEFESTKISIKDVPISNPWAKLESVSDYFNSIDIQDPYTFGIHESDVENTANSGINLDFMPASIYKCISRKQFSIKQYLSEPKDKVIGLIQKLQFKWNFC